MTPLHKYALIALAVLTLSGAGLSLILWSRLEVKNDLIDRQAKKLEAYAAQDAATQAADNAETNARDAAQKKGEIRAKALEDLRKDAANLSDAEYFSRLGGLLESAGNSDVYPGRESAQGLPDAGSR